MRVGAQKSVLCGIFAPPMFLWIMGSRRNKPDHQKWPEGLPKVSVPLYGNMAQHAHRHRSQHTIRRPAPAHPTATRRRARHPVAHGPGATAGCAAGPIRRRPPP